MPLRRRDEADPVLVFIPTYKIPPKPVQRPNLHHSLDTIQRPKHRLRVRIVIAHPRAATGRRDAKFVLLLNSLSDCIDVPLL